MTPFNKKPVKVQKRMLEAQVEQENEANSEVFMKKIEANSMQGGFDWTRTREGFNAWLNAICWDDYALLYEKNPDLIP